jgi:Bacterial antitoxin of ParD toxin-antitoxin type II system and RHH
MQGEFELHKAEIPFALGIYNIANQVESGHFGSASDVIRVSLHLEKTN